MSKISVSATLSEMMDGDLRLDATYYTSSVYQAKKIIEDYADNGNDVKLLGELSNGTYNPPPIKRVYTDNSELGTAYMLPQEMFDFYWKPKKFVLADRMPKIADWFLKRNWIVVTQSGSVGKPYFATASDEDVVLSQNAIRIPPKAPEKAGFLYAFLSTWIGQTLLKKTEFGITVKHIRKQHVDSVPVPMIPDRIQLSISEKVAEAFELRARSIKLLAEAEAMIYNELGCDPAPPSDDDDEV